MVRILLRLFSFILAACISLTGFATAAHAATVALTGDYRQDSRTVVDNLRTAIHLPDGSSEKGRIQAEARQLINDFSARYRRDASLAKLPSYTTMRTALNSLAGHYSSYPNRPLPQKLKDRLDQEFKQIEASLERGA